MIEEANKRGGYDNVTVILAKLSGSDLIEPADKPIVIYPLIFEHTQNAEEEIL